ncbi:acyl-ACP--UDP-N-acetylglucosamine O-acyltransferase [Mucisphaera calidilacus]|uniref:Acyl-[acyl-carrier-protein]--UDP-N-acetylglucosamine O-acyltransferase n=1 Tax=Mucisphaera calidilacus TaxID=2527982 RepID=A0A518BUK4_9BACT|nr:acyl-ACP--UDP-N-acetylglucosamine O-acyltransferase [Mucisphaera calidilacus]QDU70669.1 Acyl-[acyl-carrier-protein]--UDP-N-acetylglucosamine O-acyltransferase [Mucisphaera calidilacus]
MATIHPTAIIDTRAQIADDADIGPWCRIEGNVNVGPGTRLIANVHLYGPLTLGSNNTLYPNTAIGFAPQDRKYDHDESGAGVVIGDNNTLRENVTIHRATHDIPTTLGSDNYLMAGAHLAHDTVVGSRCNLANNVLLAGHVTVEDDVNIGGGSAVHQNCRIGQHAMLAGIVAAIQDVTPFCIYFHNEQIIGINVIGLRRAGLKEHIKPLKRAYEIVGLSGLANKTAVEKIRTELADDPLCQQFADFVEKTTRGLCTFTRNKDADKA